MRRTSRIQEIRENLVPTEEDAAEIYNMRFSTQLTARSSFGVDPLENNEVLFQERDRKFNENFNIEYIFAQTVNKNYEPLRNAILYYINQSVL